MSLSSTRRDRPWAHTDVTTWWERGPRHWFQFELQIRESFQEVCGEALPRRHFFAGSKRDEEETGSPDFAIARVPGKTDSRTSRSTAEYAIGWDLAGDEGWQGWPPDDDRRRRKVMASARTAKFDEHPVVLPSNTQSSARLSTQLPITTSNFAGPRDGSPRSRRKAITSRKPVLSRDDSLRPLALSPQQTGSRCACHAGQ